MDVSLAFWYHVIAASFQFLVAGMLLQRWRRPERFLLGSIVLLSGLETAWFAATDLHSFQVRPYWITVMDALIVGCVPLALLFATRIEGKIWPRAWLAMMVFNLVLLSNFIFQDLRYDDACPEGLCPPIDGLQAFAWGSALAFQDAPVFMAMATILLIVVPRIWSQPAGPDRSRMLLQITALSLGPAMAAGLVMQHLFTPEPAHWVLHRAGNVALFSGAFVAAIVTGVLLLGRGLWCRDRAVGIGGLAILASIALGAWNGMLGRSGPAEFVTQAGRPALLAWAVLRHDLFTVPTRARRVLLVFTVATTGLLVFFITALLLHGGDLGIGSIGAVQGTLAFLAASTTALALLLPLAFGRRAESSALDAYRQALEDGVDEAEAILMRRRLGISVEEDQTLRELMRTHIVVPTRSIRGLRPGDWLGGYHILETIGQGASGRAFLAEHPNHGRVVVKEAIRPWEDSLHERKEMLRHEARAAASVRHDRVARTIETIEDQGNAYLVREYADGRTLDEVVAQTGPMAPDRARRILIDIVDGLEAIHRTGAVFLDLKPENVVLGPDGHATLIDLGTMRRDGPVDATRVMDSTAIGTLAWMAPEQILDQPVDARTDLFAAGAVLEFLLTGEMHVETRGRPDFEIQTAILRGRPRAKAQGEPVQIARARRKALQRDPSKRFRDAAELRAGLGG